MSDVASWSDGAIAPVQLKVLPGIRERLREVDGWQARIRAAIDLLIQEDESKKLL